MSYMIQVFCHKYMFMYNMDTVLLERQCIMAYVNTACTGCVTIFSTGGKFRLVSNFM